MNNHTQNYANHRNLFLEKDYAVDTGEYDQQFNKPPFSENMSCVRRIHSMNFSWQALLSSHSNAENVGSL